MKMKGEIADVLRVAAVVTAAAIIAAAALFLLVDRADAEEHAQDRRAGSRHESKIYGTVERLPNSLLGVWTVNGREIVVDSRTRIKEKHGRAEAGAYVKIEGFNRDRSFVAEEIEVKRARSER